MAFHSFAEITNFSLFYKRVASNQHDHRAWRRTTFAEIYSNMVAPKITIVQNHLEHKVYNNTCHYFTEYNGTILTGTNEIKGKQKGVLTKRQILILFDLLAEKGNIERVDYTKPNKFESVAELFHAVNGKSKSTWEEELHYYKDKGPYYYKDEGELKELIKTLSNLSDIAQKSGFRILAKAADKKIRELEQKNNVI